ncbi:DUF2971 domain-containing protein [Methanosarcina sp. 2.H.A.1B.4]|uniref:DUF2971 domain-containing protein n=1 Tax=Methanosarcina sp. 2.H.A.1B.4 TaxID=1483600 RepID=UPI000AA903C3|nr:DUF2971 domain-containing protein [Methanosarcina sp. 2.H.A.1B.4]
MTGKKLFYKYQNLEEKTDKEGKNRNYNIENLSQYQLYFSNPTKFNDPFDSRIYWCFQGIEEQYIDFYSRQYGLDCKVAKSLIDSFCENEYFEKNGDLIYFDLENVKYRKRLEQKGFEFHGHFNQEDLPIVCCFSGTGESILMWSHYAGNHQGICLRFRSMRYGNNKDSDDYESPFLMVTYEKEVSTQVNLLDENINARVNQFLLNKFEDWTYEEEYRIIISSDDVLKGLLSENEFKSGLVKYQKEDLEGIVFGMKINHENAKLVYETVKMNYLDEGITVNFYEAKEIPRKYEVKIKLIDDVMKYINDLPKKE